MDTVTIIEKEIDGILCNVAFQEDGSVTIHWADAGIGKTIGFGISYEEALSRYRKENALCHFTKYILENQDKI